MATYLIDFENVRSDGLRGVNFLSQQDTVVIFYSNNADTLTFEAMDMIMSSKAQIRKFKIARGGKNALDFQLSSYLGFLIHENLNPYFYIISRDNGFHYVIDFWKRTFHYEGFVFRCPSIADGYSRQRRFDSSSQAEKEAIIQELDQEEELEQNALEECPAEEQEAQEHTFEAEEEVSPLLWGGIAQTSAPYSWEASAAFSDHSSQEAAKALVFPQEAIPTADTAEPAQTPEMTAKESAETDAEETAAESPDTKDFTDDSETALKTFPEAEALAAAESSESSRPARKPRRERNTRSGDSSARRAGHNGRRETDESVNALEALAASDESSILPASPNSDTDSESMPSENRPEKPAAAKRRQTRPSKPNPAQLTEELLLPLSSPVVQKTAALTGELCSEKQAQVAASHLIHSTGKQDFYRKMTAYFGQKHGIAVYNSLRSEYTNMRKADA